MSPPTSLVQPVMPKQQHFPSSLSPSSAILIHTLICQGAATHTIVSHNLTMFSFLNATILTLERALLYLCSLSSLSSFPLCSLVLLQVSECSCHSRRAHQKKPRPTHNPHTANVLHQRLVF